MRVLHLTDFHIDAVDNINENLRKGFYKDYVDTLHVSARQSGNDKIDYLVLTGDFVNQGKEENYAHVDEIISYVLSKFGVNEDQVAICIGNHDFKIYEYAGKNTTELISAFTEFSKRFSPGDLLGQTERAKIFRSKSKTFSILVFDSASKNDGLNKPVELSPAEVDAIANLVRDHSNLNEPLIILSHYPMVVFPWASYPAEEEGWETNHIWKQAHEALIRIHNFRDQAETIWLFGDGHIPDTFRSENHYFVMTGMFGGMLNKRIDPITSKPYNVINQARIIELNEGVEATINTFNYQPKGFKVGSGASRWNIESDSMREYNLNGGKKTALPPEAEEPVLAKKEFRTKLISSVVEESILERIRDKKLYKIGRFVTGENSISLGWVSLNNLFENNIILVSSIEKISEWLAKNDFGDPKKVVLIGVDFWGSIITSQASLKLGTMSYYISGKLGNKHCTTEENVDTLLADKESLKDIDSYVIISDVVSSGNTLLDIKRRIEEGLGTSNYKWVSISILSDQSIVREQLESEFAHLATLCGKLPIPVVTPSQLPDDITLPPKLDFR